MTTFCLMDIGSDYLNPPAFMRDLESSSSLSRSRPHPTRSPVTDELARAVVTPVRLIPGGARPFSSDQENHDG